MSCLCVVWGYEIIPPSIFWVVVAHLGAGGCPAWPATPVDSGEPYAQGATLVPMRPWAEIGCNEIAEATVTSQPQIKSANRHSRGVRQA